MAWYQNGRNNICQQSQPTYFKTINKQQLLLQELLSNQDFFNDFILIRNTMDNYDKVKNTQIAKWRKVEKIRLYIIKHYKKIVQQCSKYCLTYQQQIRKQTHLTYIHKSLEFIRLLIQVNLLDNDKNSNNSQNNIQSNSIYLITIILKNFLKNDPNLLKQTLYMGYLSQLWKCLMKSIIHNKIIIIAMIKQSSKEKKQQSFQQQQIKEMIFQLIKKFMRFQEIVQIIKSLLKMDIIIMNFNYPQNNIMNSIKSLNSPNSIRLDKNQKYQRVQQDNKQQRLLSFKICLIQFIMKKFNQNVIQLQKQVKIQNESNKKDLKSNNRIIQISNILNLIQDIYYNSYQSQDIPKADLFIHQIISLSQKYIYKTLIIMENIQCNQIINEILKSLIIHRILSIIINHLQKNLKDYKKYMKVMTDSSFNANNISYQNGAAMNNSYINNSINASINHQIQNCNFIILISLQNINILKYFILKTLFSKIKIQKQVNLGNQKQISKEIKINKPTITHQKIIQLITLIIQSSAISCQNQIVSLLVIETNIFDYAYQIITNYQSYNILLKTIDKLFESVFKNKLTHIVQYLFINFGIVQKTITFLKDFKKQSAYGIVFNIMGYYANYQQYTQSMQRIRLQYSQSWIILYKAVLEPHHLLQKRKMGQYQYQKGTQQQRKLQQLQCKTIKQNSNPIQIDCRKTTQQQVQNQKLNLSMISSFSIPHQSNIQSDNQQKNTIALQQHQSMQSLNEQIINKPITLDFRKNKQSIIQEQFSQKKQSQLQNNQPLQEITHINNQQNPQRSFASYKEFIQQSKSGIQTKSKNNRVTFTYGQKKRSSKIKSVDSRKKNKWEDTQLQQKQSEGNNKTLSLPKTLNIEKKIPFEQITKYRQIKFLKINSQDKRNKNKGSQRQINSQKDKKIFQILKILSKKENY